MKFPPAMLSRYISTWGPFSPPKRPGRDGKYCALLLSVSNGFLQVAFSARLYGIDSVIDCLDGPGPGPVGLSGGLPSFQD